jgi:hypothetical protein
MTTIRRERQPESHGLCKRLNVGSGPGLCGLSRDVEKMA